MKYLITLVFILPLVASAQNVGIGTANPQKKLDVSGSVKITDSLAIGVQNQKAKLHVKDDGVAGQRTIVGVLESNTSDRPTLLFSEFPTSEIQNGMSIEYNGTGSGATERMYINKLGGEPMVTFRNDGNVGIGIITPNEQLQVDGVMHTTNGGVRFPDGTLQTTAAFNSSAQVGQVPDEEIQFHLNIPGITTSASNTDYTGWINIYGVSYASNSLNTPCSFKEIVLTKNIDDYSPKILLDGSNLKVHQNVEVAFTKAIDGNEKTLYKMEFSNTQIHRVEFETIPSGGNNSKLAEVIYLRPSGAIEITYFKFNPDGSSSSSTQSTLCN